MKRCLRNIVVIAAYAWHIPFLARFFGCSLFCVIYNIYEYVNGVIWLARRGGGGEEVKVTMSSGAPCGQVTNEYCLNSCI